MGLNTRYLPNPVISYRLLRQPIEYLRLVSRVWADRWAELKERSTRLKERGRKAEMLHIQCISICGCTFALTAAMIVGIRWKQLKTLASVSRFSLLHITSSHQQSSP